MMQTEAGVVITTKQEAGVVITVPQSKLSVLLRYIGVYQKDIAVAAGVHQTTVSNTCLGKNYPNDSVMVAIRAEIDRMVKIGISTRQANPNSTMVPWEYKRIARAVAESVMEGYREGFSTPQYMRQNLHAYNPWDLPLITTGFFADYQELEDTQRAGTLKYGDRKEREAVAEHYVNSLMGTVVAVTPQVVVDMEQAEQAIVEEIVEVIDPLQEYRDAGQFPLEYTYKIADNIRKMQKERLSVTFSLRKLILWGQTYELLKDRLGYNHNQAIGAAYFMSVVGKTSGEERRAVVEAFNTVFGFDPTIPAPPEDGTTTHPMDYVVTPLVEVGLPVWLAGPTGCGKTWSAQQIARKLGRKAYRIQGTGDMTVDDLLGGWSAKDGSTYKEMGPLPLAMGVDGEPGLLILDEATAVPSEVLFELHAVLEGEPLIIKKFRGLEVKPEPGFGVMINDNTIGQAEANEYVGTNMMNEAFRDRFLFLDYDYMPKDRELMAVTAGIDRFTSEWVKEATPQEVKAVVQTSAEFKLAPDALARIRKAMGLKEGNDG